MSKFFPAKFHTDENKMKKLLKKKNLAFEKLKKIQKFLICLKKKKNLEEKKFNKIRTSKKRKLIFLSMCQTLLTDIFSKVITFFQECVCVCYLSHKLRLLLGTDWDVQPADGVEKLVHAHRLAHASLLEEL